MGIVIDTSAIIAVIVNEPERDQLINLTRGTNLIAPHSVHWEVGNAFSAMLRRERTTLAFASKAIELYQQIPIRFVDIELNKSLRLADVLHIYAYDAYLLRCAQKYRAPLLSLDRYLVKCAQRMEIQVLEVHR